MSVAHPWAIVIGGVGLGLLFLWHILRPQSPIRVVPSLQLWRELMYEAQASRPFQMPHPWWLLALRMLIVALLTLAAAGISLAMDGAPQQVILVIDTSASMATRDGDGRRIDSAKRIANQLVAAVPAGSDITLLRIDGTVEIIASRESDRVRVSQLIDSLDALPIAGDLNQLVQWVSAMSGRSSFVYVISDDIRLAEYDWPSTWRRIEVGSDARNDAIDDVQVVQSPDGWYVRLRIRHYGAHTPSPRIIEVRDGQGNLVAANQALFDDDGAFEWSFGLDTPIETLQFYLTPSTNDALASDDVYFWHAPSTKPIQVALLGDDRRFLPAALASLPNTEVITDVARADMVIMIGQLPDDMSAKPTWLIDARGTVTTTVTLPQLQRVALRGIESRLNRDIDISNSQILTATVLDVPLWGQRWITSQSGTHAYVGDREGHPTVVFGFDLRQSDLVLRPEFPLLVRNILDYLTPPSRQNQWQTGEDIVLGTSTTAIQIEQAPAQSNAYVRVVGGQYYLQNAVTPGLYQLTDRTLVVNLQSRSESNVVRSAPGMAVDSVALATIWGLTWNQLYTLLAFGLLVGERWLAIVQRRVT